MDKNEKHKNEKEIDILPLLKAIVSKAWLAILVGILCGAAVFATTKAVIEPVYRSSFTAYVNNKQVQTNIDYLSGSDITASKEIVRTHSQIISSDSILSAAAKSIGLDYSIRALRSMVSTSIMNETEILVVYVVSKDPEVAYDLAVALSKTAPPKIADVVEGSSMKIIDYPVYSESPYGPNYMKYGMLGFLFGFLAVVVIVIIRYFRDDTVKGEGELEAYFSFPVLGVIPDVTQTEKSGYGYYGSYGTGRSDKSSEGKEREI